MTAPWLALVESNTTGTGRLFCAAARHLGLRPVVLTLTPERYPYLAMDGIDVRVTDTTDPTAVRAVAGELAGCGLAGITSSSEYFITIAASTARALGLPAPDPDTVARCRDKEQQRAALAAGGLIVPAFAAVDSVAAAVAAALRIGLPVVGKPVAGSGSVDVRMCDSLSDLAAWAARLRERDPAGRLLVEGYVDGPEFSVETFDGEVVSVVGKHLGPAPYFVETGHDVPAVLPDEVRAGLAATARQALHALGLGWGPAHTELRWSSQGPVVVEVNPRLAGGMIPVVIRAAGGTDLVQATVARAAGLPVPAPAGPDRYGAIRFVVAEEGFVVAAADLAEVRIMPGVAAAELTAPRGSLVDITHSFRDRVGHVICIGDTADDVSCDAERAVARMRRLTRTSIEERIPT